MAHSRSATLLKEFRLALEDCERLYISAGKTCRYVHPQGRRQISRHSSRRWPTCIVACWSRFT